MEDTIATNPEREAVDAYFREFVSALTHCLRPYSGRLGPEWLGLDQHRRSMLIRWSDRGFSASLIDQWLREPVVSKSHPDGGLLIRGRFRVPLGLSGSQYFIAVPSKCFRGKAKASLALKMDDGFDVTLEAPDSEVGYVGPLCVAGLTPDQVKQLGRSPPATATRPYADRIAPPPWSVAFMSRGPAEPLVAWPLGRHRCLGNGADRL